MAERRVPGFVAQLRDPANEHALHQAFRYAVVAGVGYALAMAAYAAELALGVPAYPAIVVVFVLNGLFNFVGVRAWAFPPSGRAVGSELGRFGAVALLTLVSNYVVFALLYSVLGMPAFPAQALTVVLVAPVGFLANRRWSFDAGARG